MTRWLWWSAACASVAIAITGITVCGLSIGALAQTPPPTISAKPTEPPPKPASATDAVVLDAASLDAIIGRSVKSPTGEDMGRIVDMLVPSSGQVRAAVIDFGGFLGVGSRRIAVDWKALNFTDLAKSSNVIVALTRNQVRMAPEYKQGDPIVILEAAVLDASKPDASKPDPVKPDPVKPEEPAPKPRGVVDPAKK